MLLVLFLGQAFRAGIDSHIIAHPLTTQYLMVKRIKLRYFHIPNSFKDNESVDFEVYIKIIYNVDAYM